MRPLLLGSLFVLCSGAIAGWCIAGLVPPAPLPGEPQLRQEDYRLVRKSDSPLEITDSKWLQVPWLYADFDLSMDVELGERMDLDLLVRQVEPRLVQNKILPFHGRFSVLRLTTQADGPAWRSRDEALFGARGNGASLAAGYTATVSMQGRGRLLRANVAGKWQPWFEAADEYGMFTLVARGGKAVLRNLVIENKGQPRAWLWSRWFWAALGLCGGGVLLAVGLATRASVGSLLCSGAVLLFAGWTAPRYADLQLALPPPGAMAQLLGASVLFGACGLRAVRSVRLLLVLGAAGLLAWNVPPQLHHDTTRLDEVFGPAAGNTVSEAYAQLVRGTFELHNVAPAEARVFLLGGQLLYDRGAPEEHLEPLLGGELRGLLRRRVDVPCLPTADGHSQQQWRLFETFFTGYRPTAIVFGVPRDEAALDPATGKPRSYQSTLEATLVRVREHCRANGTKLCLFTEEGLPRELLAVLQKVQREGVPLVVAAADGKPVDIARRLAAALVPFLQ